MAKGSNEDTYRSIQDDKTLWRKVRGITHEPYEGFVFNLEVEGDHSYTAEGIGVHNCLPHAFSEGMEIANVEANGASAFISLSAWHLYTLINGGRDAGSNAGDAIDALTKIGICPDSAVPYGTIRPYGYSQAAIQAAASYKLVRQLKITTFQEALNAAYLGWSICFDVRAGGGFDAGSDGVCSFLRGWTNHEVFGGERKVTIKGQPLLGGRNSWGTAWGVKGFCLWTEDHINASNECHAIQVIDSPSPLPPLAG